MNPQNDAYSIAVDASHLYWTELHTGGISRSNLDGTGVERNFVAGLGEPVGIAVDALAPPIPPPPPSVEPTAPAAGGGSSSGPPTATLPTPSPAPKPSNTFTVTRKLNPKAGSATLSVVVPDPGSLVLAGRAIKKVTKRAAAAGKVKLTVKATGKARRTLAGTGSFKVSAKLTFTPDGGEARTRPVKLTLRRA